MIRISCIKRLSLWVMAGLFCIAFFTSCGGGSGGRSTLTAGQTSSFSPSGAGGAIEGTLYAPAGSGSKDDSKAPDSLAPVPAATITIVGTDLQAQSNLRGYFLFPDVPQGFHTLLVTAPGFPDYRCPVKVQKGGLVTLGPPDEGYVDITTASLFGKTRLSNGLSLSGTDISVNDVPTGQASDDKGECIFYNIPPGNVKITARHNLGQGWLALYRTVDVTVPCVQGQIAAPSIILPINTGNGFTGRITARGKPVSGVTIGYQGLASGTIKTDANGEYRIVAVPEGTYTLTPSGSGFSFEPSSFQITVLNMEDHSPRGRAALEAVILGPPPDRANISGTITYGASGLSGVTVTLTGAASGVTTTSATGAYVFTNLGNGNYTVTPSHPSYSFAPVSRNVLIIFGIPLPSAANFTATKILFDISGTITDQGTGLPIPNATVTWGANSGVSDGSGSYVITGCANGTNNLVATHPSYSFTPSGFTNPVTVSGADLGGRNFLGTRVLWAIQGTARDTGGSPIYNASVTITGPGGPYNVTTDFQGNYSVEGLSDGSYTVSVSHPNYSFAPSGGWSNPVVVSGAVRSGIDFTGTQTAYRIYGYITNAGTPLSGVTVSCTGQPNTTTNASGYYEFVGLSNGAYTVTPSGLGYSYVPANASVTVSSQDQRQDFVTVVLNALLFTSSRDSNPEIYVANADGTGQRRITNDAATDTDPALSPDGTTIAYATNRDGNYEIYTIDVAGNVSSRTRLTNDPATDWGPTWTPAAGPPAGYANQVLFVSNRTGARKIWKMNPDGTGQTQVTTGAGNDQFPSIGNVTNLNGVNVGWIIIFASDRGTGNGNDGLYFKNLTTGVEAPVIASNPAVNMTEPRISPNYQYAAFSSDGAGNSEIILLTLSNLASATRAANAAADYQPSWVVGDSSTIYLVSERTGSPQVWNVYKPPFLPEVLAQLTSSGENWQIGRRGPP